ncbi:MAG TPA: feruloyl-CoA synthase, partial [Ideonella sp.]|nr:feruloyl-CoA synthase [Ideonella sp.]
MKTESLGEGFRPIAFGPYDAVVEQRADGALLLRSSEPLGPYPARYTEMLARWSAERPGHCFLAKRGADGEWRRLAYREAFEQVQRLAAALLAHGLGPERPLMILSGNDLEHALLGLAAMHVGIPYVPLSPAYSLLATDHERVKHAVGLLTPGMVYASDAERFAPAIRSAVPAGTALVFGSGELPGRASTSFAALAACDVAREVAEAVAQAHAAITPETVAKFLFTSGSTKLPKAVINTHRMMCCNQVMYTQCYPFLREEPPVLVDWLPWHHTAGGNADFGLVLCHGGTLYIDDGKPTADGMAETIRNLREVGPTVYYTVPKGLETLARAMTQDEALRDRFFSRLRLIFPAGASLSAPLKRSIEALAVASCGARIPMTMGLGMTETAPFAISAHQPDWQAGVIGLPAPGVQVKLVPCGDKLEVRYKGPSITPGYWRQPELAAEAFDEEGYFRSGDGARLIDEAEPARGLRFDGRIAEDFKLASGTWVNVGALRNGVVAAGAPHVQDIVLAGHDRDSLAMLVFLLPTAAGLSAQLPADAAMAEIVADPQVRAWAQAVLDRLAQAATGSSHCIQRAILLAEPASMALGEATDKGSINQRAVLKTRARLVEAL